MIRVKVISLTIIENCRTIQNLHEYIYIYTLAILRIFTLEKMITIKAFIYRTSTTQKPMYSDPENGRDRLVTSSELKSKYYFNNALVSRPNKIE